jgi:hypothetical protein
MGIVILVLVFLKDFENPPRAKHWALKGDNFPASITWCIGP